MDGAQGDGTHMDPSPVLAAKAHDKGKRDEWSEGGVLCLLEVYESKWLLRNRAKLKGSDWEDIAQQVSLRSSGSKALKTANQCKNKIESMKKKYRAESAASHGPNLSSSWQFYARMDDLLKGTASYSVQHKSNHNNIDLQALPKAEAAVEVEAEVEQEHNIYDGVQDDESNSLPIDVNVNDNANVDETKYNKKRRSDSLFSTPRSKEVVCEDGNGKLNKPSKRRKFEGCELAESIRLLAQSMLTIEQVRLDMYKDSERIRAEAEIKRSEMELKRTEIIAKTQLEIAKLFARHINGGSSKCASSSLRAELAMLPRRDEEGD